MRILIVGPISSPIIRRLEKSLRGSGLEVFVASYNVGDFSADNVIDLGRLKSFVSYLNFFKINRLVRKLNPDLVHAHVLNHYGLMCAFQSKPLLVALWGSEVMVTPKKGWMIKRFLFRVINEFVLCRADGVHSSSQHIIDEVTKLQKTAVMKAQSFYCGFPLVAPPEIKLKGIEGHLQNEFGISGCGFIVFPRGISEIYNPRLTVEIVKGLLKNGVKNKIIIFINI